MKFPKTLAAVSAVAVMALAGCAAETPAAGGDATEAPAGLFNQELHDSLPQELLDKGFISVVGEANPPFRIVEGDGKVSGMQTDFLEALSEILGIEMRADMVEGLAAINLGMESGRNDFRWGPGVDSAATQETYDFIDLMNFRPSFIYLADADPYESVLDACGATVAVQEGSTPILNALAATDELCAEAGEPATERIELTDKNAALLAVKTGRADTMMTSVATSAYTLSQQPGEWAMYVTSADEHKGDLVGMVIPKGNDELRDALFAAIEIIFEEGLYEEILAKHGLAEAALDAPQINGATANN